MAKLRMLTGTNFPSAYQEYEGEKFILPSSNAVTQTDREYFNIVKTEDGRSNFVRDTKVNISHKIEKKYRI